MNGILPGPSNISQILFKTDEKVADDTNSNLYAFINQSRVSTYFQDNPYGTLDFSDKFGISTLGGPIIDQSPGHRPGNIFKGRQIVQPRPQQLAAKNNAKIKEVQGILLPAIFTKW